MNTQKRKIGCFMWIVNVFLLSFIAGYEKSYFISIFALFTTMISYKSIMYLSRMEK